MRIYTGRPTRRYDCASTARRISYPGGLRPDRRARSFSAKRRWIYNEVAAKVSICGTCAADLKRHRSESQQRRYLCSGFGANVTICGACAADLNRHCSESRQMRCLCSGFAAKVTICGACATDLKKSAAWAPTPRGGLVKHAFSSKVSVLPRREHRLFENRLGGVP